MKLTDKERDVLEAKRQVVLALDSWSHLIGYLKSLVEADSQNYVDKNVRKRLKLDKKTKLAIDMIKGEINEA
jgi:hypothetical protein